MSPLPNPQFWAGRRVLVTGHTGFKGSWLSLWLGEMGATVVGYALPPSGDTNLYTLATVGDRMTSVFGDVRDQESLRTTIARIKPEIVLHLAAQPLVRESYRTPVETFATNVMGTVNLLEAVRHVDSVRVVQVVTSDKCYENREQLYPYRETDALGGHDPYSASKGAAELAAASWRRSFLAEGGVSLATARAGNVIGGGDWAADRLIPDCVRALMAREPVRLRYPRAVRPWQHVLDPLAGYLVLAERQWTEPQIFAESWNFGPEISEALPVQVIAQRFLTLWRDGRIELESTGDAPHEASMLKLDISKARALLGWKPHWNVQRAVDETVQWYHRVLIGGDLARSCCLDQIHRYMAS